MHGHRGDETNVGDKEISLEIPMYSGGLCIMRYKKRWEVESNWVNMAEEEVTSPSNPTRRAKA